MNNVRWLYVLVVIFLAFIIVALFSDAPASFGSAPEELVIIARFEKYFAPSMCGIGHHPGISIFSDVTTPRGRFIKDKIEVMHDCDFIMLADDVEQGKPSSLQSGRYYRLEVVAIKAFVQDIGWFEIWEWEIGDKPPIAKTLYYCHRAELYTK